METSPSSIRTRGRFLFLTIAIVLLILPSVNAQTFEWALVTGGKGDDVANDVAMDGSSFVFVVGHFQGQAQFGSQTITSNGDTDVFLARYRTDGELDWVKSFGGPGPDDGFGVAADGAGTVCITGAFSQRVDFGGESVRSWGGRDIFVACFSTQGAVKWARHGGGNLDLDLNWYSDDHGQDIAIGPDGSVYVTGEFFGQAIISGISLESIGDSDAFVIKYSKDGIPLWANRAGGAWVDSPGGSSDDGHGLVVDSEGNVVVTGFFIGTADFGPLSLATVGAWDIFIAKWSASGSIIWAKRAGGLLNDRGLDIAIDPVGDLYVTGYFKSTADFGSQTLTASGERDAFVLKMDPDGTFDWAVPIHGQGTTYGGGIVYGSDNHVYATGGFAGVGTFGTLTASSSGDRDVYVAELDPSGDFDWIRTGGGSSRDIGNGIALNGPRVLVSGVVGQNPAFGSLASISYGDNDAFLASIDLRPQPPTLVSPEQDAAYISTSPSLVWSFVDLATRYNVQVASDAAFANLVYAENTPVNHVTFVAPVAEQEYYWRVNGVGLVGPGEWSEVGHFTVGRSGPLAPQLTAPSDNASGVSTSPALSWLAAPKADWHRIQVSSSQAFVSPEISVDNLTGTTYQVSGLDFETRYFWRVAGVSESGKSTWSAPWSFVTMPASVAAPSLIAPAQDASGLSTSPDLVWSPVEHAMRYDVQVASDDAFGNLVLIENTPETQVTFVAPVADHDYYWRVGAVGPVGAGPWSEVQHFAVGNAGPLAPQLTAPADNVSGVSTSPTLTWLAAPEADWHYIQVSSNQAFASPEISLSHVLGTSYNAMNLGYATRYFWRVAGVSESGKSTWSAPWSFVTMISPPGEVILLAPETGAEDIAAYTSFDWQGMEGVDRYHLQVKRGAPWSSTMILAVDDSTLTVSQYAMNTPLEYATAYQWRVRAHNESGFGPWSAASSFVVVIGTAVEDLEITSSALQLRSAGRIRIAFGLSEPMEVRLEVFDATGRLAVVLEDGFVPAGQNVVYWDAGSIASGVYFLRLIAGGEARVKSFVVVR